MNIMFINSSKKWGGNERWTASAAEGLAGRGHSVSLIARSKIFNGRLPEAVRIHKMPIRHDLDVETFLPLVKLIRELGIDVLMPTKRKEYFIAGALGKLLKIPVVFRLGIVRTIPQWDLPQRYVYSALPTALVVNAKKIKEVLVANKIADEEKINVIYNGYEFEPVREPARKTNKFIFAAAGRLAPQKGYDLLLQSARILKESTGEFILIIAGDGPAREEYEKFIAESALGENVILAGEIDNARELFAAADCVAIPSRNEGVPNTLFEAWSVGRAAVCSDAAGIPEVVESGVDGIIAPLEPREFAGAMLAAMADRNALAAMGARGKEKLETHFTMDRMLTSLENVFEKVIDEVKNQKKRPKKRV
ncbi:MAG: glycosyltransferase family 4 protein [Chloroflexota bacterium]